MTREATDIVTFGIPLISKAVAHDWSRIERLFNATLASLYNQTDPNFRIIVASHGRPAITIPVDERLQFIDYPRPIPNTYMEKSIDGGKKRWEIAARHVELGGGNIMFVDADDLVSSKLVAFVRQARDPNGCIITDGYVMNGATNTVAPFPLPFLPPGSFHLECATCAVMNLARSDLTDRGADGKTRYQRIYGRGHPVVLAEMIAEGRPPVPVPFPAAVYLLNTGQNLSHNPATPAQHSKDYRFHIVEHIERARVELSPEQRAEFTLPPERDAPRLPVAASSQKPQDGTDIVTFAIPLISRGASQDWLKVERLFNATLASLYNQTDPNFRIIVASNGRPALTVPVDERLQFIDRPRPVPKDFGEGCMDAGQKRWEIAARHVELGGGNIMFVDADDIVSSKLVAFVRETRDPNGCIVTNGYVMNEGTGAIAPFPLSTMAPGCFHDICGSSAVLNITPDDFHIKAADGTTRLGRIYGRGHHVLLKAMLADGRPPVAIPFPAVIYVLNNGQNLSYRSNQTEDKKKNYHAQRDERIELERVEITPELRSEFALSPRPGEQAPRLSVAISSYKRPEGLRRLLAALRPQVAGNPAREVVVVNDGSHDERYQRVVDEFKDIIRYKPLPANVGIAKARNASAEFARGAYLVFTDDDCEPPAFWLDWLEARLDHNPELDVVAGTTKALSSAKPRFLERVFAHYDFIPHPWSTGRTTLFVTANLAIRRDLFWQHGGFGFGEEFPGAGEDSELANRLLRAAARTVTDFNWYVCHGVSDTLRQQMKRYWRYGYANVWITRLTTAPESYVALIPARRRNHWQNAREQFRRQLKLSAGFAPSRLKRWASAAVATLILSAYYDGCAVAAATRRSELGL